MNLIFYSGGGQKENRLLALEANRFLANREDPIIAFIPADASHAEEDFREFRKNYKKTNLRRFICITVDSPLSKSEEKALLSADAIFLGGGNTFYFLDNLRKRRLLPKLRKYAREGGLLMGLSAGSILMTPNITTAAVPSADSDDNEIGLKNWQALGLVPFEFSPHYYRSAAADRELQNYSKKLPHPIYACADGQGIVVRDGSIHFVGRVSVFHRGSKYRL